MPDSAPRVVVVGAGVMGLATARALAQRGARVTVLERWLVAHEWSSSRGLTRAIRHEYGGDALYSRMVARSLELWRALERDSGRSLYTETGVLILGQRDDGQTLAGLETMRALGLPVEQLDSAECERRFPPFRAADFSAITHNPRGGMLAATDCVVALAARASKLGVDIRENQSVARVDPMDERAMVTLAEGESMLVDRVVVTAGPWVNSLLPELALPVRATKQQACHIAGQPSELFRVGVFPVFLSEMTFYGFPLRGSGWFKVASHVTGREVAPEDLATHAVDEDEIEAVRRFLRRVIPAAAGGDIALVDRCMYDMTPDEDFILDYYPGSRSVVIGSGFSGHGFKFGVLIGELLASLALGERPLFPLERFMLSRFRLE